MTPLRPAVEARARDAARQLRRMDPIDRCELADLLDELALDIARQRLAIAAHLSEETT
jgi:hypothetical protein